MKTWNDHNANIIISKMKNLHLGLQSNLDEGYIEQAHQVKQKVRKEQDRRWTDDVIQWMQKKKYDEVVIGWGEKDDTPTFWCRRQHRSKWMNKRHCYELLQQYLKQFTVEQIWTLACWGMRVDSTGYQKQPVECQAYHPWHHLPCHQTDAQESARETSDDWKYHVEILCPMLATP